jgi:ABC-type transporter Mla subunit MlaD
MALQDLTPQLRTRLSRMERAVGWFVFLATALLLFGFGYYIYHTAERKGWFKIKAPFHVFVQSSEGLNVKDPVYMMGFKVGEITGIQAMPPGDKRNVRVDFEIHADNRADYFRYIWRDGSIVKVNAADFLGKRELEITRGTNGPAIVVTQPGVWKTIPELEQLVATETNRWQLYQEILDANSNVVFGAYTMLDPSNLQVLGGMNLPTNSVFVYDNTVNYNRIVASWDNRVRSYVNFTPDRDTAWLRAVETPPISDQLQAVVLQVQTAVPNILALTNKIADVLDNANLALGNAAEATSNLNATLVEARPMITDLALVSAQLREPGGPLVWALGTNGNDQLQNTLTNVNALLTNTDTNLAALLINLANITSNLNSQVQANSNILGSISKIVVDTDNFVQGLKQHWLLRSAFKQENAAAAKTNTPPPDLRPPRQR